MPSGRSTWLQFEAMQARFYHLLLALRCRRPMLLHKSKQRMYPYPRTFSDDLEHLWWFGFLHVCPCLQSSTCRVSSRKCRGFPHKKPSNTNLHLSKSAHLQLRRRAPPGVGTSAAILVLGSDMIRFSRYHLAQVEGAPVAIIKVFLCGIQQGGVYGVNPVETNMWVGLGTLLQQNLGGWTWSLCLKPPPQRLSVTMATTFLEKTGNISHDIPCQGTLSSLFWVLFVFTIKFSKDINHRNSPQIQVHNRKLLRFCWEWALSTIFKFWPINI